ncbi:DUF4406 domain-containing protein [Actinomadura sp. KC216]|uniref:DUF4406 domain-containing protein n=1 Tax=Actinomadura sp. KC216 TaxID=2530370 RepID=UPI0010492EE9|nr:DUF4406 domain-containing protein [Actinomadura sp. KC216]TDB86454.1 DUF4406 domain-containing protein [Actinomadura sp. KC216]
MRIYVSGPMRGLPAFNHPAFERAACALRGQGHEVFSPQEKNEADGFDFTSMSGTEDLAEIGFDLRRSLALDLGWICAEAEAVVALPGWRSSRGARAEVATALALDLPVWPAKAFLLAGADAPKIGTAERLVALFGREPE